MPYKSVLLKPAGGVTGLLFLLLFILPLGIAPVNAQSSNLGTDFWTVYAAHIDGTRSRMNLYISSTTSTTGTVSIPLINYMAPFNVVANTVTTIVIPSSAYMDGSEQVKNLGIHITALQPVAVYSHIYAEHRSAATILIPVPALGKEYYSMNYTQNQGGGGGPNGGNNVNYSQFDIVAVEDNTTLEINPTQVTVAGRAANSTFRIFLQKGQTYQVQSLTDLTGSTVKAVGSGTGDNCKKFAVFSGSTFDGIGCANTPSRDNLYQQLYPVNAWGKAFLAAPAKTRIGGDIFRVMAQADNTVVTFSGAANVTLNKGGFYSVQTDQPIYVTASKPVTFAQYFRTQACDGNDNIVGDPEMIIYPPLEQTIKKITVYSTPNYDIVGHYINVIIKSTDAAGFTIDGRSTTFATLPAKPDYSYARITVNSGIHTLAAIGSFSAIAYGFGDVESYGYVAGTNVENLNQSITASVNPPCVMEQVKFRPVTSYTPVSYLWKFGDGSTSTDSVPVHAYASAGSYNVSLVTRRSSATSCDSDDSTNLGLTVLAPQHLSAGNNESVCSGESLNLSAETANGYINYAWSPAANLSDTTSLTPVFRYKNSSGIRKTFRYYFKASKAGGLCPSVDSVDISVRPETVADIGEPDTVCSGNILKAGKSGLPGYTYRWAPFAGLGNLDSAVATFNPGFLGTSPVNVSLVRTATHDTCSKQDTLLVQVNPKPKANIIGSPSVCPNIVEVSYWVQSPGANSVYNWSVSGGVIVRNFSDSIIVTWNGLNQNAKVFLVPVNAFGCVGDTQVFNVHIETELHTETPKGPTILCNANRFNVPYKILGTNGSKYVWHIKNGSFVGGTDSTNSVLIDWALTKNGKLWVSETTQTSSDFCTGHSDTLLFEVDTNNTHPDIIQVSTLPDNDRFINLKYKLSAATVYPAGKTLEIFRKEAGGTVYSSIATRPISETSYTDSLVSTSGQAYDYKLQITNQCDSLIIGESHRSIWLTGNADEEKASIDLSFTPYIGWNQADISYRLLINNDAAGFFEKQALGTGTFTYSADSAIEAFHQCYRILANPSGDTSRKSLSNIICFDFENPLFVPNVITPNNDGINDFFTVRNLRFYPNTSVSIYNRWGNQVFKTDNYAGNFGAEDLPAGTYYYILKTIVRPQVFKGFLVVLK
ncbi:MAG: gliding motility-associated C-terminal domain-containing protein [Bacteroidota bacterium]